jgi:hypothetical protein
MERARVIGAPADRDKDRRVETVRKIHAREERGREVIPSIIRGKDRQAREHRAECAREAPHSMGSEARDRMARTGTVKVARMGIVKADRVETVR